MSAIKFDLKDRVVLVTGGSRGIGLEVARHLLDEGSRVVICARKKEGLDSARSSLGGDPRVLAIQAHVAREADVNALFEEIRKKFSRLDVLINNVGMNIMTASVIETEPSLWQKIIDTNLNGTFLCSRKAAELMKRQGGGKIVNISSIAGTKATPAMGVYGVAKAGVEMLTRVLASELASSNIQVNAVAPSMVKTEFSRPFWSDDALREEVIRTIPLRRIAEPIDIVWPVLFFASSGSDFITGQTLFVDGGATAV